MNPLQHLDKLLKKHHARLRIDADDIVLSLPARIDADGTITHYAVEYRLGSHFPQRTPRQAPLLDAAGEEVNT